MGNVFVANENPGMIRAEYARSLVQAILADIQGPQHICNVGFHTGGAGIAMFRNITVEKFLSMEEAEYIFYIDSDIEIKDDTLSRLKELIIPGERPVVGGLYMLSLDEGLRPAMFYRKVSANGTIHMEPIEPDDFQDDTLMEVDGTGVGCLLIHRSLLEEMLIEYGKPQPWFAEEIYDGEIYGEDMSFCMRVKKLGYKVYVHTGIDVTHYKTIGLTKQNFMDVLSYNNNNQLPQLEEVLA